MTKSRPLRPPSPMAVVYTVDQFCAMMQISRDKFEDLVRRGDLSAYKVGRRTYVAKEEAERWLREARRERALPSVGIDGGKSVGIDTVNVGIENATPDMPPSFDVGIGRRPAAFGGKQGRKFG